MPCYQIPFSNKIFGRMQLRNGISSRASLLWNSSLFKSYKKVFSVHFRAALYNPRAFCVSL